MRNFLRIFLYVIFIFNCSYGHSDWTLPIGAERFFQIAPAGSGNFVMVGLNMPPLQMAKVQSDDQWDKYQQKTLSEQPNFSGWCPAEKARQIMNILYSHPSEVCVELGVFGGSSFFPIVSTLAYKQQGIAYAIDPWENAPCLEGNEHWKEQKNSYWEKIDLNKVMNKFIGDMHRNDLDNYYAIMQMSSQEAYSCFEDESIDFLHIDGNHSEGASLFDVTHWLPKVKKGGVICFDDAWWSSTQKAIKLLLQECDIMKETSPKWQYIFVKKRL